MNKQALELIQKMAGTQPPKPKPPMPQSKARDLVDGQRNKTQETQVRVEKLMSSAPQYLQDRMKKTSSAGVKKASSDMKSIIDDIIKGAEQNTFGRPVSIQVDSEFSPIDMAKVAGAVVALSEKGYSVKEASEYLGLTEKQVQDIVSTVG